MTDLRKNLNTPASAPFRNTNEEILKLRSALKLLLNYVDRFADRPDATVATEIKAARAVIDGASQ